MANNTLPAADEVGSSETSAHLGYPGIAEAQKPAKESVRHLKQGLWLLKLSDRRAHCGSAKWLWLVRALHDLIELWGSQSPSCWSRTAREARTWQLGEHVCP